jgi:hypothetical protein
VLVILSGYRSPLALTYLDGTSEQVAVVGKASSKGRTVKEAVLGLALGQLLLGVERIDLTPELEHVVLGRGDVDRF